MAQTEYERGFEAGVNAAKQAAAIKVLDLYVQVRKQEKEAQ